MGSSTSVIGSYHIHISLSTKYNCDPNLITDLIASLNEKGIKVTVTDNSLSTKETCDILRNANLVVYCSTQNYGACSTQAIEYSYLSENNKLSYNVIIDEYENKLFSQYLKTFMDGNEYEISSIQDIERVIQNMVY